MRLHHLEVSAFGPFAETVGIDFDALSDAGLFLLSGPTGAGKTSVLDAVCFALYGDVPGDRSQARRFRCDHAPEGALPRVVLELSLAGRRFRATRSPQWQRPKKRGHGTTPQQASVLIEEREDGAWVALTTRLDEAGHLVTGLLGMTMAQFTQVAMLPQGRFQAFLRSRSEDRQALLQRLFRTERFADVERWLRDHARDLHARSAAHRHQVAATTGRLLEAAAAQLPDGWELDDLSAPAESGEVAAWAAGLVEEADSRRTTARQRHRRTTADVAEHARRLDEARALADCQRRVREARQSHTLLSESAAEQESRRERAARARTARPVASLHAVVREATSRRDLAAQRLAGVDDPALDVDALVAASRSARDAAAAARSLLPREEECRRTAAALAADRAEAGRLRVEEGKLVGLLAELPQREEAARLRVEAARSARERQAALAEELAALTARREAHARRVALSAELEEAQAALQQCVAECQALKEHWLDLREARLTGMAAELAHQLAVGHSCPVCGSVEHPAKARASDGVPSAGDEKAVRARLDDAEAVQVAHAERVHALGVTLAVVSEQAGPLDGLADLVAAAELERDRLDDVASDGDDAGQALEVLTAQLTTARQRLADLQVEAARVAARASSGEAALDRARAEVAAHLTADCPTLADRIDVEEGRAAARDAAVAGRAELAAAEDALTTAASTLSVWLDETGFTDLEAAVAALLPDEEVAELERLVRDHDARLAAAEAVLADPDLVDATGRPEPDLPALTAELAAAAEVHEQAVAERDAADRRQQRLTRLCADLDGALAAWRPLREQHELAASTAALAAGTSAENAWRMRLSAFVLAWRLAQVVDAANLRLARMTDARFALEHTGQRGAGETRGGLSMLVRDAWSGEARDPATLSGGETFVVSLALALGLADVVAHEAGGAELDTLFVDEGFGSLDADTLDDVMDTLDELREGGRVVGIVSHVAELRSRVPVQLAVGKARSGSTLAVERTQP